MIRARETFGFAKGLADQVRCLAAVIVRMRAGLSSGYALRGLSLFCLRSIAGKKGHCVRLDIAGL
jgi:hypothetical protein